MERVELKASITLAIIGIIIISVIYFKPMKIERSFSGYMYAENSEFEKTIEITLIGELKKKLSLNHVFTGTIEVDGIKLPIIIKRIWAKNNIFKTMGYSSFIEAKNSETGKYEVTGTVDISKDFNEILIRLNEIDSKYNGKFNICGPSSTKEEAKTIVTNMGKNN
ncbi:hypothetical protein [Clostridium sp.]|uniref:hypothetical protein n=1 Tax=Clostridium sp. TaxID=1506 RepID=UPI003D6C87CE